METLDLKPEYLETVRQILAERVPQSEVWAFGSRVTHTGHEGSDLDLVILDDASRAPASLASLSADFSDSNLPILVDVLAWSHLPDFMRRRIQSEHVVLQTGAL